MEKRKVLLVEDDLFIRELYARSLVKAGYEVVVAIDGEEGLLLVGEKPDLILLDVALPKIHGLEVLRRLRLQDETKDIPVVIFSNLGNEEKIKDSFQLGVREYWIKIDLTPKELVSSVNRIIASATSF
jgi:DNA-binding response OmpR family regulator